MGLSQLVNDMSLLAFDLIGDLKTPMTYTRPAAGTYNPVSETFAGTATTLTFEGLVLAEKATERESAPVTLYDARILVHETHMDGLVPAEGDLVNFKSTTYKVNKVESPPSNPIYKLFLVRIS